MSLDPKRTVAELRELQELTGNEDGAQRVAWTDTWVKAQEWMAGKLDGIEMEFDEARNQWWTVPGESERTLIIGGHLDSVPNGGWLDGALNVVAGSEVLRRIAEEGRPPVTVRLVSWADEEGARFGRSLFGSSAAAGSMADQDELRERKDAEGTSLPDAIGAHGVDLDRAIDARSQLENAAAYLELHIEQGPVLESLELPLGVVLGTFGVERHLVTFRGQAAHAGSTPMDKRQDALAGAAKLELELREIAGRVGGGAVCTMGGVVTKPGIVTSVVETAECLLDQRHLEAAQLAEMLSNAEAASRRFAQEENVEVEWDRIWNIEPILFDDDLIELADESIREVAGTSHRLPSGPLHDAAEVSRAGIPTVMLFVQSLRGLSHTKLEDTKEEHLELSVAGARSPGHEDDRTVVAMPELAVRDGHVSLQRHRGLDEAAPRARRRYAEALAEHRGVVRGAFAEHDGVEIDTQGDAFFSRVRPCFRRRRRGRTRSRPASRPGPIRVRIGVHTGEPQITDEGYVGLDVHRGARICAAGHGGQVLLSQTTRELVDVEARDLGEHRLKDLLEPQRLFQLGSEEFPPLKTLDWTNLPVQATPLVGREQELAEASRASSASNAC